MKRPDRDVLLATGSAPVANHQPNINPLAAIINQAWHRLTARWIPDWLVNRQPLDGQSRIDRQSTDGLAESSDIRQTNPRNRQMHETQRPADSQTRTAVWPSESIGESRMSQTAMTMPRRREAHTASSGHFVWLRNSGERVNPEPNLIFIDVADSLGTGVAW